MGTAAKQVPSGAARFAEQRRCGPRALLAGVMAAVTPVTAL
jgi:hypothetical protein